MSYKILTRFMSFAAMLGLGLAVGCSSQPAGGGGDGDDGDMNAPVEQVVPQCAFDAACNDGDPCTADACIDQRCVNLPIEDCSTPESSCETNADCAGVAICEDNTCVAVDCLADADCDDDVFCNGAEQCDADGECRAGSPRCLPLLCDETAQACVECLANSDCDADEVCEAGDCEPAWECSADSDCDAHEVCEDGVCRPAPECAADDDCDDGAFCNGVEACVDALCAPGSSPCGADQACDEEGNRCWDDVLTLDLGGGVTMELVHIAPGTFMMGSEEGGLHETPVHSVTIAYHFYIGRYEVTQAQWWAVIGTAPWAGETDVLEQDDCPTTYVDWADAVLFCQTLSASTGYDIRLPTEAEWEYATRAGTTTAYSFGDDASSLGDYAWYNDNASGVGEGYAHPVGQKLPNPWGLYDVHGNVVEWCEDIWHDSYTGAPSDGSAWLIFGVPWCRVARGGHWDADADSCRSAMRNGPVAQDRSGSSGFRCAAGT